MTITNIRRIYDILWSLFVGLGMTVSILMYTAYHSITNWTSCYVCYSLWLIITIATLSITIDYWFHIKNAED